MADLTEAEAEFLRFQRVGVLALGAEDGFPRAIPLCYVLHEGHLYSGTGGASWKVRRLEADDRATFLVHEYTEGWDRLRGVRLWGRGTVLRSGPEYEDAKGRLFAKYPQYGAVLPWAEGQDVMLRLEIEGRASWGF